MTRPAAVERRARPGPGPVYDEIGAGYSRHRTADPRIEAAIHLALGDAQRVLNVGAGTGSYEPSDRQVVAVEPSTEMIRQRPRSAAPCVRASADRLPFGDGEFDAAMAIVTVHHWGSPEAGLLELARVARGVVVLAFDPEIHNSFWLFSDYVPAAKALPSTGGAMGIDRMADVIGADRIETVLIPKDCVDGFGCAHWCRPHAYLEEGVRSGISALRLLDPADVEPGVARLGRELETGAWAERYGHLLDQDAFDGGFRLVVRRSR